MKGYGKQFSIHARLRRDKGTGRIQLPEPKAQTTDIGMLVRLQEFY